MPASALSPRRAELAATLALAWPLALANVLQMLTYAVDVAFIARLGEAPLAASALAVAVFGNLLWALSGLTGAVAPLIAAELGARAPALRPVRRTVRMGLWLAVIAGTPGMALCWHADRILAWTGQDPAIVELARAYMHLVLWSLVPVLVATVMRAFVSALGRPLIAAAITGAGIGVNAAGNYAFVFGHWGAPALGLEGAGIATILTTVSTVVAYAAAIACDSRLARYRVFGRWWRPDWVRLGQIAAIGTPIALAILAEAGIFAAAVLLMGRIGRTELAAHTLALQIVALTFQVPFGVGQAATIRVGYFFGARDRAGIARAGWTGIAMGTGFMAAMAAAILAWPRALLGIYVDTAAPANAALVALAVRYLAVGAAFQLFDGAQATVAGALRGLQDTRVPMWIALFAYWLPGFGTALVLGLGTGLGGTGVWIGLATGLAVTAALLLRRWTRRGRRGLLPGGDHGSSRLVRKKRLNDG